MSEVSNTFKFKSSILFAIISCLIVMIAGLLRDVRFITIAWRSLLAFVVAGGITYLIVFILEFKGIINFDMIEAEEEIAEIQEELKEETENDNIEEKNAENLDTKSEESGFKPLNADNLQRISS